MDRTGCVFHVDMDAFYASVEENRRGIDGAVVVCVYSGRTSDSGAVSTCSYEARSLGIHAAMPISQAKKIAEEADQEVSFVAMDKEYYRNVSNRIREEVYTKYAQNVEQASIDEAYLKIDAEIAESKILAKKIQRKVEEKFSLTCSIGIAPNKLVAKIASDQDKPQGITTVKQDEIQEFMQNLELGEIHGIGGKTVEKLENHGITTVKELSDAETALLVEEFGEKQGIKLKEKAQGKDTSPVKPQKQKQITRITTLGENSSIPNYIKKYFPNLAQEIIQQAQEKGVRFRKVSLIVIDGDIKMHARNSTLKSHVQDKDLIVEEGEKLLERFLSDFSGQIRRIGLRIGDLKVFEEQSTLEEF